MSPITSPPARYHLLGFSLLALLAGCGQPVAAGGDKPSPTASPAAASAPTALPSGAARAFANASPLSLARRTPVAMPGGGIRLDMRGLGRHVRGLERQPDGTYKGVCIDAPEALTPRDNQPSRGGSGGAP